MVHSIKYFFTFLCFLMVISLFKMPPKIVLKCCLVFLLAKKSAICLTEETHVSSKISSGRSNCAAVYEFNINEVITYLK